MKYRIVQKSGSYYSIQVELVRGAQTQWHQIEVARTLSGARDVLDTREILARPGKVIEEREIPLYEANAQPEPLDGTERYRPVATAGN